MLYTQAILIILKSFQPYYGDNETETAREARLEVIAKSTNLAVLYGTCADSECDDRTWSQFEQGKAPADARLSFTALLITIGRFESGYAKHVHENRCRVKIGECDGGRAVSPWQIQPTRLVRHHWYDYRGADQDSTDAGAFGALITIANAYKNCKTYQGAIAQYATGSRCSWSKAQARHEVYLQVKGRLAELLATDMDELDDDTEEDEDE
jgi:hypothetical protein